MVTNEISNGARPVNGRAPVESAGTNGGLGDKFSELLRQLVGDADVSAGFGGAANLGIIQVSAAVLEPKKADAAPKEKAEADQAPVEEAEIETKDDVEVAADESEEEEEAVIAQDAVEVTVVPVAANQVVTDTAELAKEQLPVELAQEAVKLPVVENDSISKKDAAFELNKVVGQQGMANQNVKNDKVGPETVQQPTEGFQQIQAVAAAPSQKNGTGRPGEKNPQEDYARLQRILESAASEEVQEPASPEAPAPVAAVNPAAALEKAALKQEAAGQQGAIAKLGTEVEQAGPRTTSLRGSGSQGGVEAVAFGTQNAALEKAAAGKGKTQGALPPKDAQKVVDQLKELLQKAIQNRDGNSISVRLNPPELGQMTVKVTQRDSQVYARIIPESKEVEIALRARAAEVTQVLVAAGLKADQVLVSIGRERTEGESLQFQNFMGRSDSKTFEEGKDGASGRGRERDGFLGNTSYAAEDEVADSGWIA